MFIKILATIILMGGAWFGADYAFELMSAKSDVLPLVGLVGLAVMLYILYKLLKWMYVPKEESVSEEKKTETIT
jgi:hypothetical protein